MFPKFVSQPLFYFRFISGGWVLPDTVAWIRFVGLQDTVLVQRFLYQTLEEESFAGCVRPSGCVTVVWIPFVGRQDTVLVQQYCKSFVGCLCRLDV